MIPRAENEKRILASSPEDRERFLANLMERSARFLQDEIGLAVTGRSFTASGIDTLSLRNVTSIVTVEDYFRIIVALSFEQSLLDAVFRNYAEGIQVNPDEYDAMLEETAGDMVNIVVGNSLADFQQEGYAFSISPPIIICEAKSVLRYRKSEMVTAELETVRGALTLLCISPGGYYDQDLNIGVAE